MKKENLLFAICFIAFEATAQNDISQSEWFSKPITADGNSSEWNQPLNLYDSNSNMFFQMANDSTNMYLCFQIQDVEEQMRIIRSGMKISLLVKGKKKIKASISFPIEDDGVGNMEEPNSGMEANRKLDVKEIRGRVKLLKTQMEIGGFTSSDGTTSINEKGKINVGIDWDANNTMTYEVAIPFKELFGENYSEKDLQGIITLKVNVNAIQRSNFNRGEPPLGGGGMPSGGGMSSDGMSGVMGPSGGMGTGGGIHGRMSGDMGSQGNGSFRNISSSSQQIKQKFRLTVK